MKQRIENKLEYEQIPEFREKLEIIENGGSWYGCKTKDEYIRHWQKMEKLYYSIMENGYKTQRELGSKNVFDEIRIQIGRKGELLFEEGFHRLVVAQMLNLEKIPVVVYRRHKAWANLRKDVKKIVLKRGFFHQAFNHQDMDILPQWYGNELKDQAFYGNERWGYVLNSLPVKQGTVLDIGAYFGYFCHRFEDLGFECYAVELDKDNFKVLKEYRDMLGKKFTVWNKNMFEIERFDYDVVLAMNVFHHTVKTRENHEKLKAFLGRLRCKAMYFEPGLSDKPNVYKSYKEEEFVDFVISNSSLKHSRLLGHTKVGRNLYLLTP
jgi:2-polyprenyl-3-methyl-5-hydroxy-6-metoxy-1,4-benzoquinol methylase